MRQVIAVAFLFFCLAPYKNGRPKAAVDKLTNDTGTLDTFNEVPL